MKVRVKCLIATDDIHYDHFECDGCGCRFKMKKHAVPTICHGCFVDVDTGELNV